MSLATAAGESYLDGKFSDLQSGHNGTQQTQNFRVWNHGIPGTTDIEILSKRQRRPLSKLKITYNSQLA